MSLYGCEYRWKASLEYENGAKETIALDNDVGESPYVVGAIVLKAFTHESRTGKMPKVEYYKYNYTLQRLEGMAEYMIPAASVATLGASFVAGFVDRYIMTLAARIKGVNMAMDHLVEYTKPCIEQLIKARTNVIDVREALEKINEVLKSVDSSTRDFILAERLPPASQELAKAETLEKGLKLCVDLVPEFKDIVRPMEKAYESLAGQGTLTKLMRFLPNFHGPTACDAWQDYRFSEQSTGFLINVLLTALIVFTVLPACRSVCTNVLNMHEKRAQIISSSAALAFGLLAAVYGNSLGQSGAVALSALTICLLANGVGRLKRGANTL